MRYILFFLFIFLASCRSYICKYKNHELITEFNYNLTIVKKIQKRKDCVNIHSYRKALTYLVTKTGIMTKADYSSTIGYSNYQDYKSDLKLWNEWLKKNSCIWDSLKIKSDSLDMQ